MAMLTKSPHFDEVEISSSSELDHEKNWISESDDLSPPALKHRRWQMTAKLCEYDTTGSDIEYTAEEHGKLMFLLFYLDFSSYSFDEHF